MKKFIPSVFILFLFVVSCNTTETYYDEVIKKKTILQRVDDLNKSLTEIRKLEDKKSLIKEEEDYLEYEYQIGEEDNFVITYFFDAAGCYEVGLDTYFSKELDAQFVTDEIKSVIEADERFGKAKNTNDLYEWSSQDGAISIELDYLNVNQGMISFTVFANE
ncbi:MAG: hypothetical protein KDD29_00200 [Flavobacteriales bacterium]|nr:hypothetical protein [Flavobacteriales bacterium]MCB9335682.1 hypothetical protein [Flavobacteriales bacterium]